MTATTPRYSPEATLRRRQRNHEKWVAAAKEVHGADRFDYGPSAARFCKQKDPEVDLICRTHETAFGVLPMDHLRYKGGGCPECEHTARSVGRIDEQQAKFMAWFEENLAARLAIETPFAGMTKDIRLRCLIHDRLETTKPTYLMVSGTFGCRLCARESQATGNRLEEQALRDELEPTLPSHIQYLGSYFDLSHRCTKIRIECASHGKRDVRAAYLRRSSHKCPDCGNENVGQGAYRLRRLLDTGEEGRLTWVVIGEVEVFGIRSVKVGITSRTLSARYSWYLKKTFFSARLREIDALIIENRVHRTFVQHKDPRIFKAGMRNGKRWGGDTECYWPKRRGEIEAFVRAFVDNLSAQKPDYWAEYETFETPQWGVIDKSREKNLTNVPRPVVCLDTGITYASIAEASRALNLSNISSVLTGNRRLAGGFRWAYAEEAEAKAHEELRDRQYTSRRVRCVETGQVFASLTEAGKAKGISSSHITSVCKGRRRQAGGLRWEYLVADTGAKVGGPTQGDLFDTTLKS